MTLYNYILILCHALGIMHIYFKKLIQYDCKYLIATFQIKTDYQIKIFFLSYKNNTLITRICKPLSLYSKMNNISE